MAESFQHVGAMRSDGIRNDGMRDDVMSDDVIDVCQLSRTQWPVWDAYVAAAAGGLPQHLAAWQDVLTRTYGYRTHYLAAWRPVQHGGLQDASGVRAASSKGLAGVLPLFTVGSALLGRTLTTLPGGLCAEDEAAASALLSAAKDLAVQERTRRLVLHDTRRAWDDGLQTVRRHEHWLMDLHAGEEAVWSDLHRDLRRQVRMARRNGLSAVVDRTGERVDDFYAVLSEFTHQAGTPVFAESFLHEVIRAFPRSFNIVMVYHDAQPIGGYFQLELGQTTYGVWGAALRKYLELRPVYLAYWTIIADTIAQGHTCLDMGRSPAGSTASKYKGQWATSCAPVYQQTWAPNGATATTAAQQAQGDGRFQLFRQIWPHLPRPVTQSLGPLLRRQIPFA